MQYHLLGPMTVVEDGVPIPLGGFRQRAVLAVLLLSAPQAVDVDVLVDQVWDGAPPAKPVTSVRAYIANLRRALGAHRVVTRGHGYRLELGRDSIDMRSFESLTAQGKRLLEVDDPAGARRCLVDALGMWRGHPLADFRDSAFAEHETRRLEAIRADAVEARYEAELLLGHSADVVDGLRDEVAANPLREQLWGHLMVALYRSGRRADALHEFDRLRALLVEELGVAPSAALDRLAHDIRCESASLQPPTAPPRRAPVIAPLFGRADEFARLRHALLEAADGRGGAAVLLGEPGVGKTALCVEICRLADDLGMTTVWAGHPVGSSLPPAWAWSQVIRSLRPSAGPPVVADGIDHAEALAGAVADSMAGHPAVIVLDDLHRADEATYRVLDIVLSSVPRRPLLILATWPDGRPGHLVQVADFDRALARSDILQLRLAGLHPDATAELIAAVAGIDPRPDLVDSVHDRTGGNPFYVRELVRLLHDHGELESSTGSIAGIDVPDAVSGVVRRRLAGLPAATRSALLVAAMMGGEFSTVIAAAALGVAPAQLVEDLDAAVEAGLLLDVTPSRMRFSHGIIRDAVADHVASAGRARLHASIARAYDALGGATPDDRFAAADHAWRAGPHVDTDTALALLDQARTAAWAGSGYRQVADLCTRTLDVLARTEAATAIRMDREAALWLQLVSVQAVTRGQNSAVVRDALIRLRAGRSNGTLFSVAAAFSALEASGSARHRDVALMADGLIADFADSADPVAGSAGYYLRALSAFFRADLDASSEAIATLLTAVPDVDVGTYGHLAAFDVRAHGVAAWTAAIRGDRTIAKIWVERGQVLAQSRADAFGRFVVDVSELQARAILGDVDGTAELAAGVDATLRGAGIDQLAASARIVEGWARAVGAERSDTADAMRDAIAVHAQGGTRIFLPMYHLLLADALIAHGRLTDAAIAVGAAETTAAATGERIWRDLTAARRGTLSAAGDHGVMIV